MRGGGGQRALTALTALRAVLLFIALFHLVTGAGLAFSEGFQRRAVALYGARVTWGPDTVYFIRIVGTFAVFVGLAALAAARRPLAHTGVIVALAVFFLLRSASRHLHADDVRMGFDVSPGVNALTSAFFVLLAVAMLGLLGWSRRQAKDGERGGAGRMELEAG